MNPMFVPNITETIGRTKKTSDLATKLLENNIIYLGDELDNDTGSLIIMELLWLGTQTEEINFYINSPGGTVIDGLAIKDVIDNLDKKGVKVNTIGLGQCASMGAYLLSCGTGKRRLMPRSRYMLHSILGGTSGSLPDVEIYVNESKYLQNQINEDLIEFSGGKLDKKLVKKLIDRDTFLRPSQVIEYGLADEIIE